MSTPASAFDQPVDVAEIGLPDFDALEVGELGRIAGAGDDLAGIAAGEQLLDDEAAELAAGAGDEQGWLGGHDMHSELVVSF